VHRLPFREGAISGFAGAKTEIALGGISNILVFSLLNCISRMLLTDGDRRYLIAVLSGYPDRADTNSHRHLRYGRLVKYPLSYIKTGF